MEIQNLVHPAFSELNHKEKTEINGGILATYAAACVIAYYAGYGAHVIYDKYIKG